MIIPSSTEIIAAFMMEGLQDYLRTAKKEYTDLTHDECGAYELVEEMCVYANYIDQQLQQASKRHPNEFPGVFDYEVSSPAGMEFARLKHSQQFYPDAFKHTLNVMVEEYFTQ